MNTKDDKQDACRIIYNNSHIKMSHKERIKTLTTTMTTKCGDSVNKMININSPKYRNTFFVNIKKKREIEAFE